MTTLDTLGRKAKAAQPQLAVAGTQKKNEALLAIAQALESRQEEILEANLRDINHGRQMGMAPGLLDRLTLTPARIASMAEGVRQIVRLEDPIGRMDGATTRPNGLQIGKMRVPMGVIGIIYEARPNVTVDAAALCLKTGNAVILRGGKEAASSNMFLTDLMREAVESTGLPADSIQLVTDTARETAVAMMKLKYLDVLIPRGGAGLIRTVVENATVPVIETGVGNCHIYIDRSADVDMGVAILVNAKTQRPSVCNAAESLLVHADVAEAFLPAAAQQLWERGVKLRGCEATRRILGSRVEPATEEDYGTEYLDLILSIRVVPSLDEAIAHINRYSSHHSEAIITQDYHSSQRFLKEIDSAAVYVNASTRFTDGFEFGFGAEIGISTQKLHARGPMGLEALTSFKYVIYGDGQIRG